MKLTVSSLRRALRSRMRRQSYHQTLYWMARLCVEDGLDQGQTTRLVTALADGMTEREIPDREILEAVRCAVAGGKDSGGSIQRRSRPWPERDSALVSMVCGIAGADDPWKSRMLPATTDETLVGLFGHLGDPLICTGRDRAHAEVRPLTQWIGQMEGMEFIVPNPFLGTLGLNKAGQKSTRCENLVDYRMHLVVEMDHATPGFQRAAIRYLERKGALYGINLVAVVHSGGESDHAWFTTTGVSEAYVRDFFQLACRLGADPAMWTPCQWTRLPWGMRDGAIRQELRLFQ